jgi:hypothetical protein
MRRGRRAAGGGRSGLNLHRNGLSKCTSSQQAACRRGWLSSWSRCHSRHKGTAAGRQTTGQRQGSGCRSWPQPRTWTQHGHGTWGRVGDDCRRALVSCSGTACTFMGVKSNLRKNGAPFVYLRLPKAHASFKAKSYLLSASVHSTTI